MELIHFLQYSFVQRAVLSGLFIALACSALGIFLVLRKMSLVGDGLSHVSFGAIALGMFLGFYPFYIAVPIVMLASLLILKISDKANIYGDAAIGIISAAGIAGGVILAHVSGGFNIDLFGYLFGSILTISFNETIFSICLSLSVLIIIYFFYWDLFSVSFDEEYAAATGIKTNFINSLLSLLTGATVVLSLKIVGVMLVSALLILPAATALQIANKFKTALLFSCLIAIISVMVGIFASLILDVPSGATIIMTNIILFILAVLFKKK